MQIASVRFRKGLWEGIEYIFSPIVTVLILITVLSVVFGLHQSKAIRAEGEVPGGSRRAPMTFLLAITAYVAVARFNAAVIPDLAWRDRVFPMAIATAALRGCAILLQMWRALVGHDLFADREVDPAERNVHGLWRTLGWFAGLPGLTAPVGFILALAVFLVLFVLFVRYRSWPFAALHATAGIGFMCARAAALNRDLLPGLLQACVKRPWPLT